MAVIEVTEENFEEEVLKSNTPVLVDFWASWCGPCRMMAPVIEEISEDLKNKAKVCKVNVDESSELTSKYEVMSIPTFIIFENGKVKDMTVGVQSKESIIGKI